MPNTEDKKLILTKAHLRGFKSIKDLKVELKPGLNILIGPNGSGKSNILQIVDDALRFNKAQILDFNTISLEFALKTHEVIFSSQRKMNLSKESFLKSELSDSVLQKISIDGLTAYDSSLSSIEFNSGDRQKLNDFIEEATGVPPANYNDRALMNILDYSAHHIFISFHNPEIIHFITEASAINIVNSDFRYDKTLKFIGDILFKMEMDFLFGDKQILDLDEELFLSNFTIPEVVKDNLKLFTPIKDIRLNNSFSLYHSGEDLIIDNVRLDFYVNGGWVPWSYLSDGTKRMFYLVCEVGYMGFPNEGIVLIEEPELGIHPHQFHLLMQFLKQESKSKQMIISTHSPKALDALQPDELDRILIANYDKEKGTQLRRMDAAQMLKANDYITEVGFLSDYWLMSDLEEWSELD